MNSGHPLFFRASASCSKLRNVKIIFNYSENFRGNSVFRANASCSTFGMWKVYSIQLKFSGKLFFRASANWSKFLNVKRRFNTVKNFRATVFSGQAQVAQKFWMQKVHSIQWNFSGPLCFSGQALVAQKSCMIKIYSVLWIQGTLCFSGQAQVAQNYGM